MSVTANELIERAKTLAPRIAERAKEAEAQRKVADETIVELLDSQILQMLVPKKWGGPEMDLEVMLEVVEIISSACISTGWIAAFYIAHNAYVPKFSHRAQQELWGKKGYVLMPAANAPTMKAARVDGGWRVSGSAAWGSGIMHADWAMVSAITDEGLQKFVMPADQIGIDDVWHFTGMAGTGSNTMVIDNLFVPDYLSISGSEFTRGGTPTSREYDNPLYSLPLLVLAYCTLIPVVTGGLRGAYHCFRDIVNKRVRNFSQSVVKEQQYTHLSLGEMEIRVRVAQDLARKVFADISTTMHAREFNRNDRLEIKGTAAFLAQHCLQSVNLMMSRAGASNFHLDQPLQRHWRDLNTACSHAFWDWDITREQTGRNLLDLQLTHPLI